MAKLTLLLMGLACVLLVLGDGAGASASEPRVLVDNSVGNRIVTGRVLDDSPKSALVEVVNTYHFWTAVDLGLSTGDVHILAADPRRHAGGIYAAGGLLGPNATAAWQGTFDTEAASSQEVKVHYDVSAGGSAAVAGNALMIIWDVLGPKVKVSPSSFFAAVDLIKGLPEVIELGRALQAANVWDAVKAVAQLGVSENARPVLKDALDLLGHKVTDGDLAKLGTMVGLLSYVRTMVDVGRAGLGGHTVGYAKFFVEGPSSGSVDADGDTTPDATDQCDDDDETINGYLDLDGCPDQLPEEGAKDTDGDGIPDSNDQCDIDDETLNGYLDADGCPDIAPPLNAPDSDGDGIPDSSDQCDSDDETINGYIDADGCPDTAPSPTAPDSDGDGIPNASDDCDDAGETVNGYQDSDGCPDSPPDPDSDGDGILDSDDQCDKIPENYNGYEDQDGCPDTPPGTTLSIISGHLFKDVNQNGVRDSGEDPYIGGTVSYIGSDSGGSDTTSLGGSYTFPSVPAGDYTVWVQIPDGYELTTANPVFGVNVPPDVSVDFGLRSVATAPPTQTPAPPPSYSGDLTPDRGVGATYTINDSLFLCYHLYPQDPFYFRIFQQVNGGPEVVVLEHGDTGTGDCLEFTFDSSDVGQDDFRIEFFVSNQLVAQATTWILVQPVSVSYSGSISLDSYSYAVGDQFDFCYSLSPPNPFEVRVYQSVYSGPESLFIDWTDTGTGDCATFQWEASDEGQVTLRAEFLVDDELVAQAVTIAAVYGVPVFRATLYTPQVEVVTAVNYVGVHDSP